MRIFRNETTTRCDFRWLGFGYMNSYYGYKLFINASRWCPTILKWLGGLQVCWAIGNVRRKTFKTTYSGSRVKPWEHVTLWAWRFGFGFDTPVWLKAQKQWQVNYDMLTADLFYLQEYCGDSNDADEIENLEEMEMHTRCAISTMKKNKPSIFNHRGK